MAEAPLKNDGPGARFTERGADQEATLIERIGDADAVRQHPRPRALHRIACSPPAPSCVIISIWGAGTDNVDLVACKARGVTVTNTPGVNAHALAEHTIALMLAVTRRIPAMDRDVRAGQWPRGAPDPARGQDPGPVGLGAIGSRVAVLAKPFGMRMLATTFGAGQRPRGRARAQHVPVEQLLRESDIVSLHLRLSADTTGYLGKERLAMMKPTAFLINTARGGLVDKQALIDAVRDKRISRRRPRCLPRGADSSGDPLLALPELVLTPHNGGMTREVIDNGVLRAVENIQLFLDGKPRDLAAPPPGR